MKAHTIIIAGAAMGLGLASAEELVVKGANPTLVDYNGESPKAAQSEIEKKFPGAKALAITADVADESAVRDSVEETVRVFGRIDGLYNNAGIEGRQAGIAAS